jgi:hypothetical protein
MPRSKRILNGDDYKSKTEKQVNLPKVYTKSPKTEKMRYLPRIYYNDYEKIDDGFLDYIPLNYITTIVELNLRPDTAFGYPTWKSVFGGFDFIVSNDGSTNPFLFNPIGNNTIEFYSDYNFITFNGTFIDLFLPIYGEFASTSEGFNIAFGDNARFANSFVPSPFPKYMFLNFNDTSKGQKIQLFNNNRAKIVFAATPV